MGIEWLNGMLDHTFPLETQLVDAGFSADAETGSGRSRSLKLSEQLLRVLDGGYAWAVDLTKISTTTSVTSGGGAASGGSGGGRVSGEGGGGGGEDGGSSTHAHSKEKLAHAQAEVAELLRNGLSSGDAQIVEMIDEDTLAPGAQVRTPYPTLLHT
jgi:hypothetical protein